MKTFTLFIVGTVFCLLLVLQVHSYEDIKELSRQNEVLKYEISNNEKEIRILKTDMQILEEKLNNKYGE